MRRSPARLVVASPLSSPLVAHGNGGVLLGYCARRLQAPERCDNAAGWDPAARADREEEATTTPTRKRSGGGGKGQREAEKVITDITPHLAELDAEKRQKGGVDPKHVAAVLRMVWEGREHVSEKGREGERLLRHLKWLRAGGDDGEGGVEGYTDLISALAKFGLVDDCFAVFDRMKGSGVQPNEWTYTALISACVPQRDRTRAMRVFEEMREQREDLKPDAVTYTLLLKANEGRTVVEVKEAMQLLTKLKKSGVVPNVRLFDALINVISGNNFLEGKVGLNQEKKEMEEGRSKYSKYKRRDSMHDQARAQKEMREMGKAQRLELVLDVLERMKEFEKLTREVTGAEPLRANIYLFNSLFRAYKLNGENQSDFEEAFVVFEELMKPRPNVETYTTLLEIACRMRYRDHGERLIRKMKKAKSVINSKATESERAELERLKARVKKLPLSPEAVLQLQLAPEEPVEADLDDDDATIIDSTTA
ncbi:pentatricopeptide repeat domain/PPR repeatcontaining protein [Acanthamoeba castellanii str. Neff]|uniref:Pentatricopeptide repeat domain/PPR repeatcontaining protein n=1 Tax=Acanthamoeba castellanii (strain ATCC 30010 / Neff) TaxID=1257118 RepID=L8HC70_ACACF|nr:pentatricopeptide repeat domain/PPR repeatcontaining protein [Acanthamoeba castellanii str. Neff]ELR22353.1 pentatricopeptide repeat domain/PPR repeatcontaining protein [Acanthamoeba castellanii str. Neff]